MGNNKHIYFGLELNCEKVEDCDRFIRKKGGWGGVIVGGSRFFGSEEAFRLLFEYMDKKGYDRSGLRYKDPRDRIVEDLRYKRQIKG